MSVGVMKDYKLNQVVYYESIKREPKKFDDGIAKIESRVRRVFEKRKT